MKAKDLIEILNAYDPEMEVIIPCKEFRSGKFVNISWTERLSFEEMDSKDAISVTRDGDLIYEETTMLVIIPEEYNIVENVEEPPHEMPDG